MSADEEFLEWHCGMMANGHCSMAGSEDCDWDCPRTRQKVMQRLKRQRAKEAKPMPLFAHPTERLNGKDEV